MIDDRSHGTGSLVLHTFLGTYMGYRNMLFIQKLNLVLQSLITLKVDCSRLALGAIQCTWMENPHKSGTE